MTKAAVKVGEIYEGASGAQKQVTEVTDKTVVTKIVKQGTGKGNHKPVGYSAISSHAAFNTWAKKKVKVAK